MTKTPLYVEPSGDVYVTITEGEAVILDSRTEEFIGLNPMATCMWEALSSGACVDEVAKSISEEYEVEEEVVRADLEGFLETMMKRGILGSRN